MGYWDTPGQSDEWYTPPAVFEALGCRFDLDPAPARYGTPEGARAWLIAQEAARRLKHEADMRQAAEMGLAAPPAFIPRPIPDKMAGSDHVPADRRLAGDGLTEPWGDDFAFVNMPYEGRNGVAPWLDRFFDHGNGIALTPDRTSAPWFWRAWEQADLVLFTRKIRFLRPDGTEGVSPSNGTALWAVGDRGCDALRRASMTGFGILAQPTGVPRAHPAMLSARPLPCAREA